jgi:hypothetical protein
MLSPRRAFDAAKLAQLREIRDREQHNRVSAWVCSSPTAPSVSKSLGVMDEYLQEVKTLDIDAVVNQSMESEGSETKAEPTITSRVEVVKLVEQFEELSTAHDTESPVLVRAAPVPRATSPLTPPSSRMKQRDMNDHKQYHKPSLHIDTQSRCGAHFGASPLAIREVQQLAKSYFSRYQQDVITPAVSVSSLQTPALSQLSTGSYDSIDTCSVNNKPMSSLHMVDEEEKQDDPCKEDIKRNLHDLYRVTPRESTGPSHLVVVAPHIDFSRYFEKVKELDLPQVQVRTEEPCILTSNVDNESILNMEDFASVLQMDEEDSDDATIATIDSAAVDDDEEGESEEVPDIKCNTRRKRFLWLLGCIVSIVIMLCHFDLSEELLPVYDEESQSHACYVPDDTQVCDRFWYDMLHSNETSFHHAYGMDDVLSTEPFIVQHSDCEESIQEDDDSSCNNISTVDIESAPVVASRLPSAHYMMDVLVFV